MILARCPHCETTFRATPEALKARHGKVRCGKCKKAFNALDHLTEEGQEELVPQKPGFELIPPPGPQPATAHPAPAPEATADQIEVVAGTPQVTDEPPEAIDVATLPPTQDPLGEAQLAGLVAARDTRDMPGYSKWAEGTFNSGSPSFEEPKRSQWMSVLLAVVLTLMFLVQITYLWRSEISSRWPVARPWLEEACHNLGCTVPYPALADLIDIQASELQIDPARGGLLVLHLTLQNRAEFAQTYPGIELTLTDLREQVVVRRLLAPADWLPTKLLHPEAFPGSGEIAARLWIDPQDTGAVGYSLKVVYP